MHILAATNINFVGSWNQFWSAVSGSITGLVTLIGIVGMLLVVVGVLGYVWERRRGGGGGGHSKLGFTILVGAIAAAPTVVIPVLLTIVDFVANGLVSVLGI